MRVLDAPSDDRDDDAHSNVIPLLPVQSRDLAKTGRISRRRRREAVERSQTLSGARTSGGENAVIRDRDDFSTNDEQHSAAAAAIVVSHYVTG